MTAAAINLDVMGLNIVFRIDCENVIDNADRDQVVRELKRRFEPVDLRGWKNILRL